MQRTRNVTLNDKGQPKMSQNAALSLPTQKKKDSKNNVKLVINNSQNVHWTQLSLIGTLRQHLYHGILTIYWFHHFHVSWKNSWTPKKNNSKTLAYPCCLAATIILQFFFLITHFQYKYYCLWSIENKKTWIERR